ncbi:mechanosensitive ion channel domain-containing protein [Aquicella lusitana]|nr:mechanosensitive ion channel domain-containing protein [Aquicella lusitana]
MLQPIKKVWVVFSLVLLVCVFSCGAFAENSDSDETIDRIQLVTQQINLLKERLAQQEHEFADLQQQHDKQISQLIIEKASKNLLDKASLDISVSKSNLDSITIELADTQQTINWLEKNIQEIENQLNVLNIFGLKVAANDFSNSQELRSDLNYQQKLLQLEKVRVKYLQDMQSTASNLLQLKKENYNWLNTLLKSRKMLHVKQQQVKDELAFQEQQNRWLQQLNVLYDRLAKVDPTKSRDTYSGLERDIFYANESANFAYVQSLIARYKDQIQQMKLGVLKSNSISLLTETSNQVQLLNKQINRLDTVLKSRMSVLQKHISYLYPKRRSSQSMQIYLKRLATLDGQYKTASAALSKLNENLAAFRKTLDQALQNELSSRQGFPSFGLKTLMDLGKEMLLVPALAFQVGKSLSSNLVKAFHSTSMLAWTLFALIECMFLFSLFFVYKLLGRLLERPSQWRDQINSKWLSLQWLYRNFIDLALVGNMLGILSFFKIPLQNYIFIVYLALVWFIFKAILTLSRLCLVETTHHTAGHDVKLYRRLKWISLIGGTIIALTVFVHQLPLIYELKTLCDRLFLLFLMVVSLLLLRSWDVVPSLILSHMEGRHPYFQNSIRLIGILIPLLMFGNSLIGLVGYMNLVMTISWYEGVFLIVLIGYLILRGLLSDGMEQLSQLMIQYVNNGWLWTEAFLKPIDKVLRITLFLIAWAVLFLLYGWDKQSPIVERLTGLLHYQLAHVLNTTITPIRIIALFVVISVFYWTAKWTREFIYRLLLSRTKDMGIRNSIAILSQYSVVVLGIFICLRVLGIDMQALAVVAGMFAFGIGLGLRDLANNFACGFLILLERPLRVGDIVNINGTEGDVIHIGSRAVTIRTWDHMELMVPNTEIFNKSFTNLTARDNIVRSILHIKIHRHDNPHEVQIIIQNVLAGQKDILKDPAPEVFLKEMRDTVMDFEVRYYVNIRQIKSRVGVMSVVHMAVWDEFRRQGIKPAYAQHEIFLRNETPSLPILSSEELSDQRLS